MIQELTQSSHAQACCDAVPHLRPVLQSLTSLFPPKLSNRAACKEGPKEVKRAIFCKNRFKNGRKQAFMRFFQELAQLPN